MSPIRTTSTSTIARSIATSSASAGNSAPAIPTSMLSRLSMVSDTVSTSNDDEADLALSWSGRWSLSHRILAVNVLTIALVALSTLYLDVFRNRLSKERVRQTKIEATATAQAILAAGPEDSEAILATIAKSTGSRMRLFGPDGRLVAD